jgi:predicted nucleotidyltransferase
MGEGPADLRDLAGNATSETPTLPPMIHAARQQTYKERNNENRDMEEELESRLTAIARRHGRESVYVFGSRAKEIAVLVAGEKMAGATSDVDIGVQPHRHLRLDARDRVMLTIEVETLFDVHRVDLVILPEANAVLAAEVVRGELLYTEHADAEAETQLYYLRRAGDLAPFYHQQWKELVGSDL